MNRQKKIPTLLGLFLLAFLIGSMVIVRGQFPRTFTQANISSVPKNITVSNIMDNSFTVNWVTDQPTIGVAQVKTADTAAFSSQTFFDDRHSTGDIKPFQTHRVTVGGIKSGTEYDVRLVNGDQISDVIRVHSAPKIDENSNTDGLLPAYGTVVTPLGTPADGAIVYLTPDGGQTLSTLVKPSGSWVIPLNTVRLADLSGRITIPTDGRLQLKLTIAYSDQEAAVLTDTKNDAPVPEVVLGKTYDFRNQQAMHPEQKTTTSFSSVMGTSDESSDNTTQNQTIQLLSPEKNAHIPSSFPRIAGKGIPGNTVSVTVGISVPTVSSLKIPTDGMWEYSPTKPLGIGNQRVIVTTFDATKKPVTFTRLFTILKSGTQVLGDATPSATPTFALSTPTPLPQITILPTDTPFSSATPTPEIPTTGNSSFTYAIVALGVVIILGGIASLVL